FASQRMQCNVSLCCSQTIAYKKLYFVVVFNRMAYNCAPHWHYAVYCWSKWLPSDKYVRHHDIIERLNMYAVIKTGGKQYRVEEGDVLRIEKLEIGVGETVEFDQVLLVANGDNINIGQPLVDGAKVTAEVVEQGRHKKIRIVK